jgi:hypothetical protein
LKVVGASAAGVALVAGVAKHAVGAAKTAAAAPPPPADPWLHARAAVPPASREPDQPDPFLADLVGRDLGPYRVDYVGAIERGGIPVILAIGAHRFRVDVLRVDPSDPTTGIGVAGSAAVYLRNGGDGTTATDEQQGLGAMALAHEILRREREEGRVPSPALLTRGERDAHDASRFA